MATTELERIQREVDRAAALAKASVGTLRDIRVSIPREGTIGRDVAIAITHLEDAILRMEHGSPADMP